jgi:hypothetical protein
MKRDRVNLGRLDEPRSASVGKEFPPAERPSLIQRRARIAADVRFAPESGQNSRHLVCPLCANRDLTRRSKRSTAIQ